MRTDTIFYRLFQTFDTLLFELLDQPIEEGYEFISVEVKEKSFRFDGIFAPKISNQSIYFVEVQTLQVPLGVFLFSPFCFVCKKEIMVEKELGHYCYYH